MASLDQVLSLDLREYRLLCEGFRLRRIDEQSSRAVQAIFNARAALRKKNGKPVYPRPKDLFDPEKAEKGKRKDHGSRHAARAMEYFRTHREEG